MDEERETGTEVGRAVEAGVKAMRKGLDEGVRGMKRGFGRGQRCGEEADREEEAGEEKRRRGFFSGLDEGVNISLDLSGLVFGFLALGLGVAAFFIYLIPFLLVLSWPLALAGLVTGLVAVLNFRVGWFRGFLPGLIGVALSGAVLWFHVMNLIWTTGTLDYMLGLWGPPPGW